MGFASNTAASLRMNRQVIRSSAKNKVKSFDKHHKRVFVDKAYVVIDEKRMDDLADEARQRSIFLLVGFVTVMTTAIVLWLSIMS